MKELLDLLLCEIRSAWRFRWPALLATVAIFILGGFGVLMLPDQFESRAQLYVDTQSILKPLLQGIAVTPNTVNQADVVRRALLSRPTLEAVGEKTALLKPTMMSEEHDRVLARLGTDIVIGQDDRMSFYTITYTNRNAVMAHDVVKALLDTFVGGSIKASRSDTENAQAFLRQQVDDYEKRLSDSEQQIAEFKKRNVDLMPDQRGGYFQRLQTEMTGADKLRSDLAVATRQRDELRRKLSGQQAVTGGASSAPVDLPTDQQIQAATSIDSRIQSSKRQLDDLLLKYTDQHPDVISLRETIARLEQLRRVELGGVRATSSSTGPGSSMQVDAVMQNLQIQLNTNDVQVAALEAQVSETDRRVGELRRLVTTGPEIEAELARLNRDYGVTKAQYEQLLQRYETAKISDQADQTAQMTIRVLESPRIPVRPSGPKRMAFMAIVLLASLATGAGLAYLLSQTKPIFVNVAALSKAISLPVIGVITAGDPANIIRSRKVSAALFGTACSVFLIAGVLCLLLNHQASLFLRALVFGATS